MMLRVPIEIRELTSADAVWARQFLERTAGATRMVSRGRLHQCDRLPGFYTEEAGRRMALLTYRIDGDEMEVVTLHVAADERGKGHGTMLLDAARRRAARLGCRRLWLVTTNDNVPALRFYERRSMRRVAVHRGAVDVARRALKPEIPLHGIDGVPIRDEIELEIALSTPAASPPGTSRL
jgi:ribosomal protein S18 acetylase RimI-like enzyme